MTTIYRILTLRSQWIELVKDYKLEEHSGTIHNLRSFIETGAKGNRFRQNFDVSYEIAKTIINYYESMGTLGR